MRGHALGISALLATVTLLPGCTPQSPDELLNTSYYQALQDPALKQQVQRRGQSLYAEHCASCHGGDMKGRLGVPDLTDYDTLWGNGGEETDEGNVMAIQQTLLFGIRNQACPDSERKQSFGACPDTRYSNMVGFGAPKALSPEQVNDMVDYVLALAQQPADAKAVARATPIYAQFCVECHAADGRGIKPYGGPDLTDEVWLYGGGRAQIHDLVFNGKTSSCPPWGGKLRANDIRTLAIFLYAKSQESI